MSEEKVWEDAGSPVCKALPYPHIFPQEPTNTSTPTLRTAHFPTVRVCTPHCSSTPLVRTCMRSYPLLHTPNNNNK
jgi:hypothetical protein